MRISMNNSRKRKFFTENLMLWNNKYNRRTMPWKGEKDPYKIWLSEIILQQTRVEQGLEYYNRFLIKYPKVELLAVADENEVFKLWEGLGYYSRCKNLIVSARIIAFNYDGIFPNKYEDILKLKGVGPYTCAAIASFAFNLPHAVVDGNVLRVIARFFGIDTPIDSIKGKKVFNTLAQTLMDTVSPALYNQAIMDFGATICKPQLPLCST
ncbi:MAG: A/G-specific adenine glycosylase, partial [Ferruginibacter sp.]|nr:A/G-specific adenine glycosylase [Ferruginibacter sp.]